MPTPLHLQLDPRSGVPAYRQLMDQLKYYIAGGTLRPGDQLPSIRELATALAVNPTTVVRVYTELEREKVLEMRHGKGAFVGRLAVAMPAAEQEQALRRSARQLALEACQLGLPAARVVAVIREEMEAIRGMTPGTENEPTKFSVLTGGAS
jgi:GntR family transcriptional regulator